jgi:hypothetical protein
MMLNEGSQTNPGQTRITGHPALIRPRFFFINREYISIILVDAGDANELVSCQASCMQLQMKPGGKVNRSTRRVCENRSCISYYYIIALLGSSIGPLG